VNTNGTALLEVKDVETFYGSIQALKGISLEVYEGEIVTLIGASEIWTRHTGPVPTCPGR